MNKCDLVVRRYPKTSKRYILFYEVHQILKMDDSDHVCFRSFDLKKAIQKRDDIMKLDHVKSAFYIPQNVDL